MIADDYTTHNLLIQPGIGGAGTKNLEIKGNLLMKHPVRGNNVIFINSDEGKVTIGPQTYVGVDHSDVKLAVSGKLLAKEIHVKTTFWADTVFKPEYKLMKLTDLENYIKVNGKLPEIPSEGEVLSTDIDLGQMNVLLLKKVEELTLYVLSLNKELETLKSKSCE